MRRATSKVNTYWQVDAWTPTVEEPGFSSPEMDSKWQELVNLYNTSDPGFIFEILGREDCDNRAKALNHTIESASLDFVKRQSHLSIELVHTFDCHYVIGQNQDDHWN